MKIGFLLFEQVQPMDVIGPWEVFSFWKYISKTPIDLFLISESGSYVTCDNNITMKSHINFTDCPQLDCLIIPGGRGRVIQEKNETLLAFINKQEVHCQYLISVCTGAFLLYQSGLVKEGAITTYWRALPELLAHKDIHVEEKRIVKSGKIWSSGGISSGIDLALALIAEVAGKEVAGQVQLLFEYFPASTLYASDKTLATLPPYYGNQDKPHLSAYIKEYLDHHQK